LIDETVASLPELNTADHVVRAQAARVAQAGAWPDPVLQLGIQNDGFKSIEVGHMETSFVSLMASQTMPWPGKTGLREAVSELSTSEARQAKARIRLSAEATVRRGYLDLMTIRDRRLLLDQLELLWKRSLGAARAKYETGTGAQVDLLRSELELTRIKQQRAALDAAERSVIQLLNRMRHHALDEPIPTTGHVQDLPPPSARAGVFSPDDAVARSPELAVARVQVTRATKQIDLAQKSYFPDLTFGAGFMYRGSLPPMWLLTVAAPVPVFAGSKQGSSVTESRALDAAARSQVEVLEQLVRLRSVERQTAFANVVETIRLYEQGLLTQSAATAEAMLAQYQVGRASFASVLEANAGLIADKQGYLQARVDAERLLIAEREVSLLGSAVSAPSAGGGAMPGAMSPTAAPPSAPAAVLAPGSSAAPAAAAPGGSMSGM
jgi:outer membrane protein TolC